MELVTRYLEDLQPYENNPRVNDAAVKEVMESIKQCGYVTPIVINADNVILAGHTRYDALRMVGGGTK